MDNQNKNVLPWPEDDPEIYPWEAKLEGRSYVPGQCEWGYPTTCGAPARFVFDPHAHGDRTGYPVSLFACRKHVLDLRTGAEPRLVIVRPLASK